MSDVFITRIELQNPRKKLYSLYQDDTFLVEISEDTLVQFAISKGKTFTHESFAKIIKYDKVNACLVQAYNYLQRRPHLKAELVGKLKTKQYTQDIIDGAMLSLQDKKYIDDKACVKMFINEAMRMEKSGPMIIKKKLSEKGASMQLIEELLDDLFPIEKQVFIAQKLLISKNSKMDEPQLQKRKQKLLQFGINRGFSWQKLEPIISEIVQD